MENVDTELARVPSNTSNIAGSNSTVSSLGQVCSRRSRASMLLGGAIVTILLMSGIIISLTVLLCARNKENYHLLHLLKQLQDTNDCYSSHQPLAICETRPVTADESCTKIKIIPCSVG